MLIVIFEKYSSKLTFFNKSPFTAQFQPFFLAGRAKISEKKRKKQEFRIQISFVFAQDEGLSTQYTIRTTNKERRLTETLPFTIYYLLFDSFIEFLVLFVLGRRRRLTEIFWKFARLLGCNFV